MPKGRTIEILFTFHNVSINSSQAKRKGEQKHEFTFHNVSINSETFLLPLLQTFLIYIP